MAFQPVPSLTVDNARSMLAEGLQAIAGGQHVIDFSGLTAVDSAAVALLLSWQRAARAKSITLSFINVPHTLQSLTDLYGVAGLLPAQVDVSGFLDPSMIVAQPLARSRSDLPHH